MHGANLPFHVLDDIERRWSLKLGREVAEWKRRRSRRRLGFRPDLQTPDRGRDVRHQDRSAGRHNL